MKITTLILLGCCLKASAFDPLPCPNLHIRYVGDRNGITIGFETVPTYNYTVLSSTNLVDWKSVTNFNATSYVFSAFFSSDNINVQPRQFFKIKYTCNCYE